MHKKLLSLKRKLWMILSPASRNRWRTKFTSGRGQIIIALWENFAGEIDDAINDAMEIGGEEEEEEFDDEEEEIELPEEEEMLGEEEREDSMSWSNDVDLAPLSSTNNTKYNVLNVKIKDKGLIFWRTFSFLAGNEVNNSFPDNSANAANKNKMAQVHLGILIPYFEEFPQPTTEQKLELA